MRCSYRPPRACSHFHKWQRTCAQMLRIDLTLHPHPQPLPSCLPPLTHVTSSPKWACTQNKSFGSVCVIEPFLWDPVTRRHSPTGLHTRQSHLMFTLRHFHNLSANISARSTPTPNCAIFIMFFFFLCHVLMSISFHTGAQFFFPNYFFLS